METEFKIPTHPASETLFSRHAMTALLASSRVGDVSGRSASRTNRGLHSPPGAARSPSPGQPASSSATGLSPNKSTNLKVDRMLPGHNMAISLRTSVSSAVAAAAAHHSHSHISVAASHAPQKDRSPQHTKSSSRAEPRAASSASPEKAHVASRAVKPTSAGSPLPSSSSHSLAASSSLLTSIIPQLSPTAATAKSNPIPAESSQQSQAPTATAMFTQPRRTFDSDSEEVKAFQQPFYFESDHMALKTNRDYQTLLKTMSMLEAQRIKAIQDLDLLIEGQEKALEDPIAFVQRLQNREDLGLPRPQKVAQIPSLAWENYTGTIALDQRHKHRHMTRHNRTPTASATQSAKAASGVSMTTHQDKQGIMRETIHPVTPTSYSSETGPTVAMATQGQDTSRQQNSNQNISKPENFNKPWSIDEQKRLEQLLIEYPPEEVEARRWEKIARALGNRTMLQVASRVQKYFIKLAKAGLPIPGRMPNMSAYTKKSHGHRHQRHNRLYNPFSTFLASHEPPVHMADDDDLDEMGPSQPYSPGPHQGAYPGSIGAVQNADLEEVSDDESIPMEFRDCEEYRQIMRLKRMRKTKLKEEQGRLTQHIGFKCDSCNTDPIMGTRWHCTECPEEVSVDFCSDCIDMNYENDLHSSSHSLEPIHTANASTQPPHIDQDYVKYTPSGYSYLDPNYMPAS